MTELEQQYARPLLEDSKPTTLLGRLRSMNRNVVLTILVSTVSGIAASIFEGAILVGFVYVMTGSNASAGYVEASQGVAELVMALPIGYLADKYPRSRVIKFGGILVIVASALTFYAIWRGSSTPSHANEAYYLLMVALGLWGTVDGISYGPMQALYADSTLRGMRSEYYAYLYVAWILSTIVGPVVSIAYLSDESGWELPMLRNVIFIGVAFQLSGVAFFFMFDDSQALPEPEPDDVDNEDIDNVLVTSAGSSQSFCCPKSRLKFFEPYIPHTVFIASLVMAIGSGLTVQFFPLFFKNTCHMTPSQVQAIYVVIPIAMVIASWICQRSSRRLGRVQTTIVFKIVGLIALFVMVYLKDYHDDWRVMAPIFVVRTAFMNATYPLEESILMDTVPKDQRARWKSLESVASCGWCGSAALGGYLSDHHGYPFTFLITGFIQLASTIMWIVLIPVVPDEGAHLEAQQDKPP